MASRFEVADEEHTEKNAKNENAKNSTGKTFFKSGPMKETSKQIEKTARAKTLS